MNEENKYYMDNMKIYSQEEMLERSLGPKGTPERDEYEAKVDDYMVGLAIRRAREARNLTQEQLAEKVGVSNKTISKWETGKCMPDYAIVKNLCDELEITIAELMDGEEAWEYGRGQSP